MTTLLLFPLLDPPCPPSSSLNFRVTPDSLPCSYFPRSPKEGEFSSRWKSTINLVKVVTPTQTGPPQPLVSHVRGFFRIETRLSSGRVA